MAVAELFIGAFITVLFEKLASSDLIRLAQSVGVYSELNKWKNTLIQIQAVLVDAGQKHIRDKSVQLWLNKLQHLAYEIDDVLDDLATEALRSQLNRESSATTSNNANKVLKFIQTKCHAFKYGHKMSSKLDEITAKLHDLVEEKNLLGLNDNVKRLDRPSRRLEETSLVGESKIIGREGDKEALLGKLLGSESSSSQTQNVNVVSIVGMGGIGKTTLAQLLYNDKKVKNHFKLMAWVCISDEFDVFNISKAIFQAVGGGNQDFANLNLLQVALADNLLNQRFLFVLDDVWNENYNEWKLLQRPFTVGAPGSKIIVTTRKTMVASVMDSVQAYPLKLLSDEEALSLFAHHASGKQNFDLNRILKMHGEDIIKKCGRLPLALITLGRVFRTKTNEEEWEELLNNEIWNLDDEGEVLPALKLSYYDLPPHLKQMFVYCCLFPKDYMFDKYELVLLWMAEGFLYESKGNKSMESFGRECFEELVSRSFFQHSSNDKSQYTMHDLINDLAMSVAGEFFSMLDDKMDVYDRNEVLENVHHISFNHEPYVVYRKFKALQRTRRLRTILAMPVTRLSIWEQFYLSNMVFVKLLPQLQFLRVLSLANYSITEIPRSIGSLKHLRYLNFSNTKITCLPEQVGDLHNLQSLLLSGCSNLSSFPKSIVMLVNLRHLDISDTPQLKRMPLGIGGLTSLQTLSKVIIGGANEFEISNLKGLLHLQGQLSIVGLHRVRNVVQVREANLQQKKCISDLHMEWGDVFNGSQNETTSEYEVLEELKPFEKLRSLKILYYNGSQFPSWVGDPSFVCLTQLTLRDCRSCTCLPTLGHLSSLQKLFIGGMYGLKTLGFEFLGPSDSYCGVAFPSLEVLEFIDMRCWEEWSTSGGEKVRTFPRLREISIINCPQLDVVAIDLIPSIRVLRVEQCSEVVLRSLVSVSSSIARLRICNIKGLTQLHGEFLKHLLALEYLEILECYELTCTWESKAKGCNILSSLQKLVVSGCVNLEYLGEKKENLVTSIESLREVKINYCPKLQSYNCPNSIEKLEVHLCPLLSSITFPTVHDLPSTLKKLNFRNCDNLKVGWLLNNFLSSLESLSLQYMSKLRLFPEGCLVHLTKLEVSSCDSIESIPDNGYGFLPFLCLRELWIINCKNLKSFPHEHLQGLTSLKLMWIYNCPSMDYSFPCGLWPPNLSSLKIGSLNKSMSDWGPQNLPNSLNDLTLYGAHSQVVIFAKAEDTSSSCFVLPSSLTRLDIFGFMELESLSEGLQHLTGLRHLFISKCPKLRDLPKTLLPSLLSLLVSNCSGELRKKCRKGKYWPIISQIPYHYVLD